jgi:hypothetical protein
LKVIVDVFDRRLAVIDAILKSLGPVQSHGAQAAYEQLQYFDKAKANAPYLFGREVIEYLHSIRMSLIELGYYDVILRSLAVGNERSDAVKKQMAAFMRVSDIYKVLPEMCAPYLKLDHKRVRTPLEWIRDKNRERLSYSDLPHTSLSSESGGES